MEIVSIDKAGRIVIPGTMRKRLKLNEGAKLLIADVKNDLLIIKKINIEELAEQLETDFKKIDIDTVVGRVRSDIKEKIRKKHPSVFGWYKSVYRSHQESKKGNCIAKAAYGTDRWNNYSAYWQWIPDHGTGKVRAGIYHAATCLQEGAILITNDRHFDRIRNEKIIEVWGISKAIEEFGIW
jgi:AbrB family looped-hinge helix DNA binding protein